MSTLAHASRPVVSAAHRAHARLLEAQPRRVVAAFVVVEWVAVLALALTVRHAGWIFYQGGDQLWYYTSGWALGHGQLPYPLVGYLWSALLTPVSLVAGPDLVSAYPPIILFDVVILLPVALAALFGTARLIGGRSFGYLTLLVWLVIPFIGIRFTNTGYHQRYTELILPQGFGLTAMADFPTMVAALVAAYFVARVIYDGRDVPLDAAAAGVAAGAAIGIKPSTALFIGGPIVAFLVARRFRGLGIFLVALLPAVATLSLWKWRGLGYLPLLHGFAPVRSATGADPVLGLHTPHYLHFDWAHFTRELDLLREHFWSGRILEWLIVAGLIAIGRRSVRALALVGVWFAAFAIVKGGYSSASIEDSSLLRILIPAIPAFVLLIASLPFLLPRGGRPWPQEAPGPRRPRRLRLAGVAAGVVVTALAPFALIAAASPVTTSPPQTGVVGTPLIPTSVDLGVGVRTRAHTVLVSWRPQHSAGGPLFYHVFRAKSRTLPFTCNDTKVPRCVFSGTDLGTTRSTRFVDERPRRGRSAYFVGVAANWLNDSSAGDVYLLSRPATITVP